MQTFSIITVACVIYFNIFISISNASEPSQLMNQGWPKELTSENTKYIIYQPQLDAWDNHLFKAHAAVAVTEKDAEGPIYGVIAFEARTRVNKSERLVTFEGIDITSALFPSVPDKQQIFRDRLQLRVADFVRTIALDRVEASMALLEARKTASEIPVKNDAPNIIFSSDPAILVFVDGKPVYEVIEGTSYQRILNTRVLILKNKKGEHFLSIMEGWMTAPTVTGSWKVSQVDPLEINRAKEVTLKKRPADLLAGPADQNDQNKSEKPEEKLEKKKYPTLQQGPVPRIVSTTVPTEMIIFDGEPNYVTIPNTELLYADNTTGHVFRHLKDQYFYLLISGRWFRGAGPGKPWQYMTQKMLPEDFAQIPDSSPKENVKASVAGTAQAQEAMIANAIPETADIIRSEAKYTPTFDGKAKLVAISGTDLYRVENSPDPIIQVTKKAFYALHNGVWFVSSSLQGPWVVADTIPASIYSIPASSPVHNVTYVRIYDASPTVVVVGYTPGYYGAVTVNGVVVCGTGYYYTPWIGGVWYGNPMSYGWGCGITYSPWSGWSYSYGIGYGWGYWGSPWWGPYPYPYWGPYSAYPSYYGGIVYGPGGSGAVWGPGGWAGTTGNVYHRWGTTSAVTRASGGYNAYTGDGWRNQVGVAYNSRTGTLAAGQRAAVGNVYTGDYAYGKRGVAGNREAGIVAGGSKVTLGNTYSGKEVTAARGAVYNRNTDTTARVGGIKGEQGSVIRVGDNVFGSKNGDVYRRSGQKNWEKFSRQGEWSRVNDVKRQRNLDRQRQSRKTGFERSSAQQRSRRSAGSFSGGGSFSRGSFSGGSFGGNRSGGVRRR